MSVCCLQLDKMDASARSKAEMAQKIAQELLKSSSHRMGLTPHSMPALSNEQSNIVRAAQQKAAEIAVQASALLAFLCTLHVQSQPCRDVQHQSSSNTFTLHTARLALQLLLLL